MSARDDYPLGNTHGEVPRWRAMCDEIDRLRNERDRFERLWEQAMDAGRKAVGL